MAFCITDRRPTLGGMINRTDIWSYKLADDTCLECDKYVNVTDFCTSTGCAAVAQGYGITVDQLVNWNRELQRCNYWGVVGLNTNRISVH